VTPASPATGALACARGHEGACRILAHVRDDFGKACDAGRDVRDACTFSGLLSAQRAEAADASEDDRAEARAKALAALGRACDAGAAPACAAKTRLSAPAR